MSEIEKLVGLRADQLTTDEGRLCVEVLLHGPRTEVERLLLESLEELVDGKLNQVQFRRWLHVVKPTIHTANADARLAAEAERARTEVEAQAKAVAEEELLVLGCCG